MGLYSGSHSLKVSMTISKTPGRSVKNVLTVSVQFVFKNDTFKVVLNLPIYCKTKLTQEGHDDNSLACGHTYLTCLPKCNLGRNT